MKGGIGDLLDLVLPQLKNNEEPCSHLHATSDSTPARVREVLILHYRSSDHPKHEFFLRHILLGEAQFSLLSIRPQQQVLIIKAEIRQRRNRCHPCTVNGSIWLQ